MTLTERVAADYASTEKTTGPHPMALLRARVPELAKVWRAGEVRLGRQGQIIRIAGHVICRQRPGSAKGFAVLSLEDETGIANAIVPARVVRATSPAYTW